MRYDYTKSSKLEDALYEYLELMRLMRATRDMRILDVGCGMNFLKSVYPHVVGVDIAENSRADVIADALQLPFKDNSFDAVVSVEVIEHIPYDKVDRFISELKRVSRKYVGVSTANRFTGRHDERHVHEFTIFELIRLFKRHGLRIKDIGYGGMGGVFRRYKILYLVGKWVLPWWFTSEWICIVGEKT